MFRVVHVSTQIEPSPDVEALLAALREASLLASSTRVVFSVRPTHRPTQCRSMAVRDGLQTTTLEDGQYLLLVTDDFVTQDAPALVRRMRATVEYMRFAGEWDMLNGCPSYFFAPDKKPVVIESLGMNGLRSEFGRVFRTQAVGGALHVFNGPRAVAKALRVLTDACLATEKSLAQNPYADVHDHVLGMSADIRTIASAPFLCLPAISEKEYGPYADWEASLKQMLDFPAVARNLKRPERERPVAWFLCWDNGLSGCGMPAHALQLASCFHRALRDSVDCVIVTDKATRPSQSKAWGVPAISYPQALRDARWDRPQAVFQLCWVVNPEMMAHCAKHKSAIALWKAGGTVPDTQSRLTLPFLVKPELLGKPNDVQRTITTPGKDYTNSVVFCSEHYRRHVPYLEELYEAPVDVIPYLYSTYYVRNNFEGPPEEIPDEEPKTKDEYRTHWRAQREEFHALAADRYPTRARTALVAEPNSTPNKTSLIPLFVADRAKDSVDSTICVLHNLFQGWLEWQNTVKHLHRRPIFVDRQPLGKLGARAQILVSHQTNCAMNLLVLDGLFLGLTTVHNSDIWKHVGLYYKDHDIPTAIAKIRSARPSLDLADATVDLLWEYSMMRPENLEECRRLYEWTLYCHRERAKKESN